MSEDHISVKQAHGLHSGFNHRGVLQALNLELDAIVFCGCGALIHEVIFVPGG